MIYGRAEPKTSVGDNFSTQLRSLAEQNEAAALAVMQSRRPTWFRPAGWNGNPFDIPGMKEPFSRKQQETEFRKAVADPDSPGTTADLEMVSVQGQTLQVMERAFRLRMASPLRNRLHAAARLRGHGREHGAIISGLLGYVANLDAMNKGEKI